MITLILTTDVDHESCRQRSAEQVSRPAATQVDLLTDEVLITAYEAPHWPPGESQQRRWTRVRSGYDGRGGHRLPPVARWFNNAAALLTHLGAARLLARLTHAEALFALCQRFRPNAELTCPLPSRYPALARFPAPC